MFTRPCEFGHLGRFLFQHLIASLERPPAPKLHWRPPAVPYWHKASKSSLHLNEGSGHICLLWAWMAGIAKLGQWVRKTAEFTLTTWLGEGLGRIKSWICLSLKYLYPAKTRRQLTWNKHCAPTPPTSRPSPLAPHWNVISPSCFSVYFFPDASVQGVMDPSPPHQFFDQNGTVFCQMLTLLLLTYQV